MKVECYSCQTHFEPKDYDEKGGPRVIVIYEPERCPQCNARISDGEDLVCYQEVRGIYRFAGLLSQVLRAAGVK